MSGITVKITGVDSLLKKLEAIATKANREYADLNIETGRRIETAAKRKAVVGVTGNMRAAITTREYNGGMTVEVAAPMEYSSGVEEGTKPHWPQMDSLRQWVRLKMRVADKDVDRVTYLVARKIAAYGTDPQPFLGPSWDEEKDNYVLRARRILGGLGE